MKLKEKNKLDILKYKLLFEEEIVVSSELSIGSSDFLYHLNHFRKKLEVANNAKTQVQKFDHIFF